MSYIYVSSEPPIMVIIMNRPQKRNALTRAMYGALAEALDEASANPEIRVVLISGAGGAFTSGNDLSDFLSDGRDEAGKPVARFLRALAHFEKPIVAATSGPAVGIGATMLLHCDLVYAHPTTRLQFPFVNVGLVPEAGSSLLLPLAVGQAKAAELLYFGDPIDAAEAERLGLVNAVVADADAHARARAEALATRPPEAVRDTRRLLRSRSGNDLWARIQLEGTLFEQRLNSPETQAAVRAVLTSLPSRVQDSSL